MTISTLPRTIDGIAQQRPISVLLLEDEVYYGKLVQRTLRTAEPKFELMWATTLAMALDMMTERNFDVIVSDLELPDARRLMAVNAMRELDAGIPIVVLTAHNEADLGLQAIREGADDFIIKERVSADSLVRTVSYAVERKRCEDSRLRAEAINDFMGMLAHDLRSPLIGTWRVLEFLDSPDVTDERRAEMLTHLRNANRQMLDLVSELVDVYRYELTPTAQNLQPTDLLASIRSVISALTPAALARRQRFELDTMGNSKIVVWADKIALDRMLTNLLDNACKFSPEATTVKIHVSETDSSEVRIDVIDRGQGIAPEVRDSLFKRFWHGMPGKAYAATNGLGLYLCHKIAEAHKGKIWFESSDSGTTFSVTLWPTGDKI
jgi:signal transduction histidine kinase